jgi:membrane protein DedA with SNARE-associated domain
VPDIDLGSLLWPMIIAFASLVAAGIGAPIPEEIPTIGAGIWVASNPDLGSLAPLRWLILPVCFVGILISDVMLYGIGRRWGTRLLEHRFLARLMPPGRREQIESNFHRYGVRILLMVRWMPGIRSPMFVTAGTMRLPLYRFIVADAIAAVVGHSLLFFLAYWFGDQFKTLVEHAEKEVQHTIRPLIILAAIIVVAVYLVIHFWKRPVTVGDPKELPIIGPQVAAKIEHSDIADECPPELATRNSQPANGVDAKSEVPESAQPEPH